MDDLFTQAKQSFKELQQQMCAELSRLEPSEQEFIGDEWRSKLGQGSTNIMEGGELWEKAGVAFSEISGAKLPSAASARNVHLADKPYNACGISIVIHPRNPYVPTSHANLRIFTIDDEHSKDSKSSKSKDNTKSWWFGGGFDLTPYYIEKDDCELWHQAAKNMCDKFDKDLYAQLKQNCEEYFYLPHRQESRGIGGIFFDDFNPWEPTRCLDFVQQVGECYKDTYKEIAQRLMTKKFGDRERNFQLHRRGRYVEFNLLYDRGTLFGIQSGGRSESILMSLPPQVRWSYRPKFAKDSPEGQLIAMLQRPSKPPQ